MKLKALIMTLFVQNTRSFLSRAGTSVARARVRNTQYFSSASMASIDIYNDQKALANIDEERLRHTMSSIRSILGYEHYSVALYLVDDEEMRETNFATRNVDAPTDILSFPMHAAIQPGELEKPEFDIPDVYCLGDMIVDVPYVIRQCKEDEEWEYEDDDDRGVSAAMLNVFDPELRIHMLLVHGMLHLVGYDHIEDHDYELMVTREEEMLKNLGLLP